MLTFTYLQTLHKFSLVVFASFQKLLVVLLLPMFQHIVIILLIVNEMFACNLVLMLQPKKKV